MVEVAVEKQEQFMNIYRSVPQQSAVMVSPMEDLLLSINPQSRVPDYLLKIMRYTSHVPCLEYGFGRFICMKPFPRDTLMSKITLLKKSFSVLCTMSRENSDPVVISDFVYGKQSLFILAFG